MKHSSLADLRQAVETFERQVNCMDRSTLVEALDQIVKIYTEREETSGLDEAVATAMYDYAVDLHNNRFAELERRRIHPWRAHASPDTSNPDKIIPPHQRMGISA